MMNASWQTQFQTEIETAQSARQRGNEGMARVCARRAAGLVCAEYLRRRSRQTASNNAYDLIKMLAGLPDIPPQTAEIAAHFLVRLSPDHTLPIPADLIAEAVWLKRDLLDETA